MDIYQVLKSSIKNFQNESIEFLTDSGFSVQINGKNLPNLQSNLTETIYILILSSRIYQDIIEKNSIALLNGILSGEI